MQDYLTYDFSELNTKFYQFDREELLASKSLKQRLSSSHIDYSSIIDQNDFLKKAIRYITKISYGLFKYVTNETVPNFKFDFNNSSYCGITDNILKISLSILQIENMPYQNRVDCVIGLVFHEMFHKRFTNRDIMDYIGLKLPEQFYKNNPILKTPYSFFVINKDSMRLHNIFCSQYKAMILNILEDRRIEEIGVKQLPGYGFFLDELRKFCFFHLKGRKQKINISEQDWWEWFFCVGFDFLTIKILMPELENYLKEFYKDFIINTPKLQVLIDNIDDYIKTKSHLVYSNNLTDILTATEEIFDLFSYVVVQNQEAIMKLNKQVAILNIDEIPNRTNTIDKSFENDLIDIEKINESKIDPSISDEIIKIQQEVIEEMKGENIDKKILITKRDDRFQNFMHIDIKDGPIDYINTNILNKATRLSQEICKNIGFLNSRYNRVEQDFEQEEGEIDESELYGIKYNKNIFYVNNDVKGYDLDFGILLDESYSMINDNLIEDGKLALLTLMISLHKSEHINLFAYGHSTDRNYIVKMFRYYNSLEKFTNVNSIFSAMARESNADGFAIQHMGEIMMKSKSKNKILMVISDGQPNALHYTGDDAIQHTKESIEALERKGFYVIQICMANIENSSSMFKHFIPFENDNSFIKNVKSVLIKKLNYFHNNA